MALFENKLIGFLDQAVPGNAVIAAGATRQFTMIIDVAFTGRNLIIAGLDVATGTHRPLRLLSLTHDNRNMITNGGLGLLTTDLFPNLLTTSAAATSSTGISPMVRFHEEWNVGDRFGVNLTNPFGGPVTVQIVWITDAGEGCARCGT